MFKVILFYANGCIHCDELKPKFNELIPYYSNKVDFELKDITTSMLDYQAIIPKQTFTETVKDEAGNEVKKLKRDENGKVIYEAPLEFPNTVFLHNGQFIGNIVGNNIPAITHILDSLTGKEVANG